MLVVLLLRETANSEAIQRDYFGTSYRSGDALYCRCEELLVPKPLNP